MGADEDLDVTHRLTMLGVNEVCILSVHVEKVFKHTEDKAWDGEDLGKGMETELRGEGNEERNCQQGKKYPPLLTPRGHKDGHQDRDACQ